LLTCGPVKSPGTLVVIDEEADRGCVEGTYEVGKDLAQKGVVIDDQSAILSDLGWDTVTGHRFWTANR